MGTVQTVQPSGHQLQVSGYGLILFWWGVLGFSLMFSVLFWEPSVGAGLNLFDLVISLPALAAVPVLFWRRGWLDSVTLRSIWPLLAYTLYALASMSWAIEPNIPRSFRAGGQLLGLFLMLSIFYRSGAEHYLKLALSIGIHLATVFCLWHLLVMYGLLGVSIEQPLYTGAVESSFLAFGVDPINQMHATLLVAPMIAMQVALYKRHQVWWVQGINLISIAVMVLFLLSLQRRSGMLALLVLLFSALWLYRSRWLGALLTVCVMLLGLAIWLVPDVIFSRGTSWRPEIWMSTWDRIQGHWFFGHGLSNTEVPVPVFAPTGELLQTFLHPHNLALTVWFFLGGAGLLLWCILWVPGLFMRLRSRDKAVQDDFFILPMLVGASILVFDGGEPMALFHFDWFCFWLPVLLMLSSNMRPSAIDGVKVG